MGERERKGGRERERKGERERESLISESNSIKDMFWGEKFIKDLNIE